MPPLKNARHERFARLLFEGNPADTAYQEAGYKANDGNAIRLKGNERVAARVRELEEEAAGDAIVTKSRVLAEYARIAFSDVGEVARWTSYGVRLKDSDEVPLSTRAAIQEISSTETQNGTNLKVKFHTKLPALEFLAKHLRMLDDSGADASEKAQEISAFLQGIMGVTHGGFQSPQTVDTVSDPSNGSDGVDTE